jgi:hypothetical protein
MKSEQFDKLMGLAERLVTAYERDTDRKWAEWEALQEELAVRKAALDSLTKLKDSPGTVVDVDFRSGLQSLFEEDDDEDSGD